MSATLSELTCMCLHRPGPDARPDELAGWFDELATVHEHLAAEVTDDAERAHELALAASASRHAHTLRNPTTDREAVE